MQISKKIYFSDYKCASSAKTGITIAFSDSEDFIYSKVKHLSSSSIRDLINIHSYEKLEETCSKLGVGKSSFIKNILSKKFSVKNKEDTFFKLQSTFTGGKGSPMHDWYPYLEGYSPEFVKCLISKYAPEAKSIIDPFCGSGTTAIVSVLEGLQNYYCEVNPLCQFIIETKLMALKLTKDKKEYFSSKLFNIASNIDDELAIKANYQMASKEFISIFGNGKFFEENDFHEITTYRNFVNDTEDDLLKRFLMIAGIRSLIPSSLLVRRGDLRFKTAKELEKGNKGFKHHLIKSIELIASDLLDIETGKGNAEFICDDAKKIATKNLVDVIITSPPYLNGTNYFRNTKIELWFIGELKEKSDLRKFRDLAITSGINDVTKQKNKTSFNEKISNIPQLISCLKDLSIKEYDSRISMMVENYFWDMFSFLSKIPNLITKNGTVCIDLGDSMYCGVHIPTQDIIKEAMDLLGMDEDERIILRERKSRNGKKLVQTVQVFKRKIND